MIIYALFDKRFPSATRYVGATRKKYLCSRIVGHRYDARNGREAPISCWIREVLAANSDIDGIVLEVTADPDAEARWIEEKRLEGHDLLNSRSGGARGGSFDDRSRQRLSASNKRAFAQPEWVGKRQGENSPTARLTTEKVLEMRRIRDETAATHRTLAEMFGVDRTTVGKILSRALWSHV